MSDRKRYSKKREAELWRLVDKAITDFRILVLRGKLAFTSHDKQEAEVWLHLGDLPDKVCQEYRKSYAANKGE